MISVIIPMYNSRPVISRCIQSVMSQSYTDFEIIVIDDGSTDGGADIVMEIKKKDNRLRYIRQENGGVSRARNRGLDEARGEYICFIDSDDAVEKDYLSWLYHCIREKNCDIVMCGYREVSENSMVDFILSKNKMDSLHGNLREDLEILRYFISSPCMKIFKKEKIDVLHLRFREDMALAEDRYFNYQYFLQCETIAFVNRPLYYYYRNDAGLSKAVSMTGFKNEMDNLAYMIFYMENAHIMRRESMIAEYICYCIRRYTWIPGEKNTLISVRERLKRIRQYDKPAKLYKNLDTFIYWLLRMKCYSMIFFYYRLRRRV